MREKFSTPFPVSVDDIKFDIQNFRYYGELSNQRDCIEAMLNDPNSGVRELARDIAEYGLTPDPIVISKDDGDEWVVREGNRRIAALKLLNNSSIASDKKMKKRFRDIAKQYEDQIPTIIDCITCDDESCILEYLDRVHSGFRRGTGRRDWSPENKSHFNMHMGKPAEVALAMKVKKIVQNEGVELPDPYYITNLQRVLQNKSVQSKLGYSWDGENIRARSDRNELMSAFKEIAVRSGKKKVREIYTKTQQSEFVDDILNDLKIDPGSKKGNTYKFDIGGKGKKGTKAKKGRLKRKPSWDRKRLIPPQNTSLHIPDLPKNTKANNIVTELSRKIDVREAPNAAAVLMRVLLEFSVVNYIKNNDLKDTNLASNIRKVAGHMARNGIIEESYKDEVMKVSENQNLLSAKTLQRYVHSFQFNPDKQTLCILWDNLDPFIAHCWK